MATQNIFSDKVPEKILFLGQEIYLPKELFYYARAKAVFSPKIKKVYSRALREFDENIGSMELFIKNAENWFPQIVRPLLDFALKQLAQYGSYEFDEESLFNKYAFNDFDHIKEIHQEMLEEYSRIQERQEAKNAYRVARRQSHGDWTERNIFSTLGDMVKNGIGRGIDEIQNQSEYSQLFNNEKKEALQTEIVLVCMNVLDDFTFALYDSTGKDARNPVDEDSQQKAENILMKMKKKIIPKEQIVNAAIQAFSFNPLTDGLLEWCIDKFGDTNGEIQKIAEYFWFEEQIINYKEKLIMKKVTVDSMDASLASKAEVKEIEKRLNYASKNAKKIIDEAIQKFNSLPSPEAQNVMLPASTDSGDIPKSNIILTKPSKSNPPPDGDSENNQKKPQIIQDNSHVIPTTSESQFISTTSKSTALATFLCFWLGAGVGQIYLGQVKKGIIMLLIHIFLGIITGGISMIFTNGIAMIDAYKIGTKLKNGKKVAEMEFF